MYNLYKKLYLMLFSTFRYMIEPCMIFSDWKFNCDKMAGKPADRFDGILLSIAQVKNYSFWLSLDSKGGLR